MFRRYLFLQSFLFVLVSSCLGSSAIRMSLEQLVKGSTHVFYGHVRDLRITRVDNRTYTEVKIDVLSSLKEKPFEDSSVTLLVPGGTINGISHIMIGAPNFEKGEEIVVFVKQEKVQNLVERTRFRLVGLAQSKFKVTSRSDGKKVAISAASNSHLALLPDKNGEITPLGGLNGIDLDELFREIINIRN